MEIWFYIHHMNELALRTLSFFYIKAGESL